MTDSRYPYTYAYDFIRSSAGYNEGGTRLSRADAASVCAAVAGAIGMSKEDLACKLADAFKANEEAIAKADSLAFMRAQGDAP